MNLSEKETSALLMLFTHNVVTPQNTPDEETRVQDYESLVQYGYAITEDNEKFTMTAAGIKAAKQVMPETTFTYNMFGGL